MINYSPYVYRLPVQAYTPIPEVATRAASLRQLKKEYVRLRNVAVKGGQRLQAAGFSPLDAFSFPTLTELKGGDVEVLPEVLTKELARLAQFISDPRRTVSGAQKYKSKKIEQLQDAGLDFVDDSNFDNFIDWMEFSRTKTAGRPTSSEFFVMLFNLAENGVIPISEIKKDVDKYVINEKQMVQIYFELESGSITKEEAARRIRELK